MLKKSYLILLCFFPLFLYSQNKLPENMFLKTLPNGLDVLVIEDNSVPLATIHLTFKNGTFVESEKSNGLTQLYQNMLLKNNREYNDIHYQAGGLGIQSLNSRTSVESANIFFTMPKANTYKGLNLMNSMARFATMDPEELEKEKKTVDNELLERESNPYYILSDEMLRHLWGDLYSRKKTGSRDVIKSATIDMMDSIKNKYCSPNNSILIVGGDVAHDTVFNQVEKVYGNWKASSFDPFKKWPVPEFKPLQKSDYFICESKLSQSPLILLQWQGPDTRNDVSSTYTADVFSYVVNERTSNLNNALVQSGLAFSIGFSYLTLKHVGPISLIVRPNPAKVRECMDEIKRQITLMDNSDYISAEQIETAKRMLEIAKIREEEITTNYVNVISFWWASASLNYFYNYNNNLKRVSRADILNYIKKYIKNRPYCAGLLINPDLNSQIKAGSFFTVNN